MEQRQRAPPLQVVFSLKGKGAEKEPTRGNLDHVINAGKSQTPFCKGEKRGERRGEKNEGDAPSSQEKDHHKSLESGRNGLSEKLGFSMHSVYVPTNLTFRQGPRTCTGKRKERTARKEKGYLKGLFTISRGAVGLGEYGQARREKSLNC